MQLTIQIALLSMSAVMALPAQGPGGSELAKRVTAQDLTITDQYLFDSSLSDFMDRSRAQDPSSLDWTNDGCSNAPDAPFGFRFLDACIRHDFGYRNYKAQGRFTESARAKIDNKFRKDLRDQCSSSGLRLLCVFKADTYYWAVRNYPLSGATPGKRDETDLTTGLDDAVAKCDSALQQAQSDGLLSGTEDSCSAPTLVAQG
ncbi:hypothetical protein Purlil1_13733 [Purpureocillium lilacinum]|uniref:Phospholipase A2 n=1 Tax=Purpureocillium lilacinum TaxID=33203 RepID=A0ABR0BD74_PURLI|nr:hypothetical protein Purlil1_13733 [Purpureocillium lilacinum]